MLAAPMTARRPITPRGLERIEKELSELWYVERPRVVQEVSEAAAHGDRSENAEYTYGKRRLREIDRRVQFLTRTLEIIEVIDPAANAKDTVDFGATVLIEDEYGRQRTYQLVGEDEVDAKAGRISMKSPMGRALLGRRVGDDAIVQRPAGDLDLVLLRIAYV